MTEYKKLLVVGAGFAGAVVARSLAETGRYAVTVIDRRDHVGGNAYDPVCADTGQRYHKYGPHFFHTNSREVVAFLSRFTEWLPYRHQVKARVEGIGQVPLPINITTLNELYGKRISTEDEMRRFLSTIREPVEHPANAEEYLWNLYGRELTELFFRRYTKKMWDIELNQLPASVVARLPVRYDDNPYYFNDKYQFMPKHGYLSLFNKLLDHPSIDVSTSQEFEHSLEKEYSHVFNSISIDEYFDYEFGELPYRSIIFNHATCPDFEQEVPTVNFTTEQGPTRVNKWCLFPGLGTGELEKVTYESPVSFLENDRERFYPVRTVDGAPQAIHKRYKELARGCAERMTFIGRCGQYIYYDMDQVVANSLAISKRFLAKEGIPLILYN